MAFRYPPLDARVFGKKSGRTVSSEDYEVFEYVPHTYWAQWYYCAQVFVKKKVNYCSRSLRQFSVQGKDMFNFERYAERFETLEASVNNDGVAKILLNRPDKMNAMNMKLWEELKESFDVVNNDSTVRCIILSSTSNILARVWT